MSYSRIALRNISQLKSLQPIYASNLSLHSKFSTTSIGKRQTVTVIPGDGTGPELIHSLKDVFTAAAVPVDFDEVYVSEIASPFHVDEQGAVDSVTKNKVCLKGIIASPLTHEGSLLTTLNMRIRRRLDLFANVVHVKSVPGLNTRHDNLDFVIIREQKEGEYSALEHESVPGVVESLKIITRANSTRIAKFAFDYAITHGRKKVTAIHKANIMKLADGLFLECCREVAKLYPTIEFDNLIIDNCCMQLVSNPYQFDVMVMPNLYGNIVDNLGAGLVGGAGIVAGESYSSEVAVFEPGARHTFASMTGRDVANPTAILFAASNMLKHINLESYGDLISNAVKKTIVNGKVRLPDMGGYGTRTDYTYAIIDEIQKASK